jgi:hypothetical protein
MVFSRDAVRELLDQAREAVAALESLRPQDRDCRMLVTFLFFRERKQ